MAVQAKAMAVKMSPRKIGVVAALVRNRTVEDAMVILEHTPRRSAQAVKKVIESARANASHNHNYKADTLRIVSINVSPGPSLKRFRPIARGQAHPFEHQTAHITVVVDGEVRPSKAPAPVSKETK